ncbi:MAG: GldG family protein [Verrucomicrobiota bacterium]|nr:GldG family protein [Verrucomicrobiota bacterium]
MANETENPPAAPARPKKIRRFQIGLNVLTQLLIVIAIAGFVNYISFRQFKRWDLTRNQKYALSPQTRNLLKSLEKPAKAVVFFSPQIPIAGDVNQLLKEYEYASNKKFDVEFVEPYRNIQRAKELAAKYKFGSSDNIVILDYDGRTKFVNAMDMAELEQMDQLSMMTGQPPRIRSFKGEQAITSALLEITEPKQNKIYLTAGHGEADLNAGTIGVFKDYAERQNVKLDTLKLNDVDKVPDEATGLLIFGPHADFSEREIQLVREFWERKGRLFVLLDPQGDTQPTGGRTPRLDAFLTQYGVKPRNDRVIRVETRPRMDAAQRLDLVPMLLISPTGVITPGSKEIVGDLAGMDIGMPGLTQSLELERTRETIENLRLTSVIESSKAFWGETELVITKDMAQPLFEPEKDHQGPLTLAAAVEKGAVADPRVKVETGRMLVMGNAGWLTDDGIRESQIGIDFAMNSLNWLLNREQLIGIAPKPKEPVKLDLGEKALTNLAFAILLVIPGIVAVVGVGSWLARRA